MRNKIGLLFMAVGAMLLIGALSLFVANEIENNKAGEASEIIVEALEDNIVIHDITEDNIDPYDPTMTEVEIDGNRYIGYVIIPNLEMKLPVMSDWSYEKLKISPCRFSGSTKTDDLVIMAHNYKKHFKSIENLTMGDAVLFKDMDGSTWEYEVSAIEILGPNDVEDMNAGIYDLTLFTCTYDGQNRITVRCSEIED